MWQQQYALSSMYGRECLDVLGWPVRNRGLLVTMGVALLGRSAFLEGNAHTARSHLSEAFESLRASRITGPYLAEPLEWLAAVEAAEGQLTRAARLFGGAEAWWLACGVMRYAPEQPAYERDIANLRAQLEEAALTAAWAEGRAMTLDQVLAYALDDAEDSDVSGSPETAKTR
jgi:hypothetical protein